MSMRLFYVRSLSEPQSVALRYLLEFIRYRKGGMCNGWAMYRYQSRASPNFTRAQLRDVVELMDALVEVLLWYFGFRHPFRQPWNCPNATSSKNEAITQGIHDLPRHVDAESSPGIEARLEQSPLKTTSALLRSDAEQAKQVVHVKAAAFTGKE